MKVTQIALNRSAHSLFLKDTDTLKLACTHENKIVLEHNGNEYDYGYVSYPHFEFENKLAFLTMKLMSLGKGVNWSDGTGAYCKNNTIEFKPCKQMKQLVMDLADMKNVKDTYGCMRLMGIISRCKKDFLTNKKSIYEMVVSFSGHYVAGSYVHDYTAAATYSKALKTKFPDLEFKWLKYDSSNNHAYFFKFLYTVWEN